MFFNGKEDNKVIYRAPILQEVMPVTKETLENDRSAQWVAKRRQLYL